MAVSPITIARFEKKKKFGILRNARLYMCDLVQFRQSTFMSQVFDYIELDCQIHEYHISN